MQIGLCRDQLPAEAVRILSPSGTVFALKYDMRFPFAQWLVQKIRDQEMSMAGGTCSGLGQIEGLRRWAGLQTKNCVNGAHTAVNRDHNHARLLS